MDRAQESPAEPSLESLERLDRTVAQERKGGAAAERPLDGFWTGSRASRGLTEQAIQVESGSSEDSAARSLDRAGAGQEASSAGQGPARQGPPAPAAPVSEARAPGELPLTLLMALWSFLTIGSIYIVMPVRSAMLMTRFGPEALPWVYMASAAATGAAVWAYQKFARLPRARLLGGSIAVLSASLAAWWAVASVAVQSAWVSFAFYLWTDVFAIMSVTLLWTFANDVFSRDAAKRQFGRINAAGTLGGLLGAFLVHALVPSLGAVSMLGVGLAFFTGTLAVLWLAERAAGPSQEPGRSSVGESTGFLPALRLIRASPLLLILAALVALERLVPDFSNYLYSAVMHQAYPNRDAFAAAAGRFEFYENILALVLGFFFTHTVLKRLGTGVAVLSAPLANLLGFLAFFFWPSLGVAVVYNSFEGLFRHTWFKSGKEASYTVAGKEAIYQVKPVVEMFFYRLFRGVAGFILLFLAGKLFLGLGLTAVALAAVPLGVLWVYVAWRFGREARDMEKRRPVKPS